ncbi:PAS domain-containing sensor histidine kinase [Maritalea porphyrae]|jgi:cell cycle sensor histidine kinase DivJ|uniref:PAS domain-containing sensor histidine kinase n=1 Tax=Maritalea porphyrae TaxID=880732 RepID=UPI0022AF3E6D|nr:PAS domain-containing sensor histidine kinase [Maritalea porphyrae]MCZ4271174.1 PAS domain-containing sensor histidine kinase [Maritalea porphyrae]
MRNPLAALLDHADTTNSAKGGNDPGNSRARSLDVSARASIALALAVLPIVALMFFVGNGATATVFAILAAWFGTTGMLAKTLPIEARVHIHSAGLCLVALVCALLDPSTTVAGISLVVLAVISANFFGRRSTLIAASGFGAVSLVMQFLVYSSALEFEFAATHGGGAIYSTAAFAMGFSLFVATLVESKRAFVANDHLQIRAFRSLVESVRDAVARYSADGRLIYLSHTSEALFGCKRYELSGSGLLDRVHVLDRPNYMKTIGDVSHKGKPKSIDVRIRCEREERSEFVWVEVAFSAVHDRLNDDGRAEVIAIMRNISSRKQQEVDLEEAKKVAESASEAKSRFLATIGHELRTPLNAVVGFSDMMINNIGGELSPDHLEYAELIKQSGHHLLDTVSMLLDMSKLEAGKFEISTDRFDPQALVEPCFAIVKNAADKKNIELVADVGKHLPMLTADERACRQVLINLLSNAIKFSPENAKVILQIRLSGTKVALRVIDHGVGVAPEDVARLGEPFFQAQNGLNRQYEGTGLGLSIVRGLTELHGGDVLIKSKLGEGTQFSINLPIDGPVSLQEHVVLEELSDKRFVEEERKQLQRTRTKAG